MIEFDEYKVKLNNLLPRLEELDQAFDIESAEREADMLTAQSEDPRFWDDMEKALKIQGQLKKAQDKLEKSRRWHNEWDDLMVMCEMGIEEDDDTMLPELQEGFEKLLNDLDSARMETLFTGEYDKNDCMISLHAGAGGTEAQDWTLMLMRMYTRWAERHGFTCTVLDMLDGEEAGIKSATIQIKGENAYGYLRSEHGVHRLVRISPFDSNARRQTSFSAVEVMPDLPDDTEDFEIRPEEYEMQVYRSSGAGGQHINKTSSAVRLIHHATGVVVSCQTERSQFQNKETCLRMLRAKLIELKIQQRVDKISDIKGEQMKIEWGSQIRSYVFMPYTLVKDTRTAYETSNVNAVMDGDLDGFINAYLTCEVTGNWATK
jgi:peptide chain release factor 2